MNKKGTSTMPIHKAENKANNIKIININIRYKAIVY